MAHGYRVRGAALPDEPDDNIAAIRRRVKIDRFDITNRDACRTFLTAARPDYLFHLAAIASVGKSFSLAELTIRVNTLGSYHILEAVKGKRWLKKLVFVSSSEVYGPVKADQLPLRPNRPFNPLSPYGQSKVAAEYIARTYIEQCGVPAVIVRPFNHAGPRQSPDFVVAALSRKIAAVEKTRGKKVITVGNLSARRDIADVRDIARGYRLLAEKGRVGEAYHLCTGRAFTIKQLLNKLLAFSDTEINVQRDPALYRISDIPALQGSFDKTRKEVGWKPEIEIQQTLEDTLNFWRRRSE